MQNNNYIRIKHFLILLLLFFCHFFSLSQQNKIDSLLRLIKKDKEDTTKVIHLNKLTAECYLSGDYEKGSNYGQEAIELATVIADEAERSNKDIYLGAQKGLSNANNILGNIFRAQGNYPEALDCFLKALRINEKRNNKNAIAANLGNIGIVYLEQGDYPKALDYNFKALKISEELGNKNFTAHWLGNIGNVYKDQADANANPLLKETFYKQALDYYFKALKIRKELGIKNLVASTLGNIGVVFMEQAKIQTDHQQKEVLNNNALDYYFKSLKMKEELEEKNGIAICLSGIGSLYTKTGKYKEAEIYLKRAIAISDSIGALDFLKQDEELLSELYDTTGNYQQAFIHYKKAMELKDSIFSEEKNKELTRKEMNYDFEKKTASAKAEQDKKDAVTKIVIYSVSTGFALVLLLAVFIFRGYRQKQKANIIISQQKLLVEEKQKDILDSIHYARRIQKSLMPTEKYIERKLKRNM